MVDQEDQHERRWHAPLRWKGRWWNVIGNAEFLALWVLGVATWFFWGHNNTPVRAEDVIPQMGNGDLLLFSGLGLPQNLGTKMFTASDKSHTAVIVVVDGEPLVLESSVPSDHSVDVLSGISGKDGVRLVRVREKINEYYEHDAAGPITFIPLLDTRGRRQPFWRTTWGGVGKMWITTEHKKSFNSNVFSLIGADEHALHASLFSDIACPAETEHKRFCSELVAAYLRRLGVLLKTRDDAQYCPADFYHAERLALAPGAAYGPRYDLY